MYWEDPETHTLFAVCGSLLRFPSVPSCPPHRCFGALAFAPSSPADLFVPKLLLQRHPNGALHLTQQSVQGDLPIQSIQCPRSASPSVPRGWKRRNDLPAQAAWCHGVQRATQSIQKKELEKVVLARRTTLHLLGAPCPFALLSAIKQQTARALLFAYQPTPNRTFLGATPELLYRRHGCELVSDALAGTAPRHASQDDLLLSDKQRREFDYVKQGIEETLRPLCQSGTWEGADRVVHSNNVQHLHNRFHGLLEKAEDAPLLEALHPTAATAGRPKSAALEFLSKYEPFPRGWYAAPIGWMDRDAATFAVGIRSAQLVGNRLHLYAGAGIVDGSDPEAEWEELEHKIAPWIELLATISGHTSS